MGAPSDETASSIELKPAEDFLWRISDASRGSTFVKMSLAVDEEKERSSNVE